MRKALLIICLLVLVAIPAARGAGGPDFLSVIPAAKRPALVNALAARKRSMTGATTAEKQAAFNAYMAECAVAPLRQQIQEQARINAVMEAERARTKATMEAIGLD